MQNSNASLIDSRPEFLLSCIWRCYGLGVGPSVWKTCPLPLSWSATSGPFCRERVKTQAFCALLRAALAKPWWWWWCWPKKRTNRSREAILPVQEPSSSFLFPKLSWLLQGMMFPSSFHPLLLWKDCWWSSPGAACLESQASSWDLEVAPHSSTFHYSLQD